MRHLLWHLARCFDLFGVLTPPVHLGSEVDDWRAVGDDLRAAMGAVERAYCVCGADLIRQPDGTWRGRHRPFCEWWTREVAIAEV